MAQRRAAFDMPLKCFETGAETRRQNRSTLPRSYIYATRITPADTFGPFFAAMTKDPSRRWRYYHEIDASHSPNVTAPDASDGGCCRSIAG